MTRRSIPEPRRAWALTVVAVLVAACGGAGSTPGLGGNSPVPGSASGSSPSPSGGPSASATGTPSPTASEGPTAAATPGEGEFANPVIDADFPDPHVINVDGTYYAYATTGGGKNLQASMSEDLVEWEMLVDPLPQLASWSGPTPLFSETPHKATWAPAAAQIDDRFLLYYTTPALEMERPDGRPSQCIGVAVADDPAGPFVD